MIIAISGKINSGKDTVGKIIQWLIDQEGEITLNGKPYGENTIEDCIEFIESNESLVFGEETSWEIKKFAGKLKQIVSILTGIPVGDFEKQEVKNQELGEEWWKYRVVYDTGKITERSDWHSKVKVTKGYSNYFSTIKEAKEYESFLRPYEDIPLNSFIETVKPTVREIIQNLGTDLLRDQFHPNTHVNALFADYKPYNEKETLASASGFKLETDLIYPNWIITDVRFPNELQAVKEKGGITIRVNRNTLSQEAKKGKFDYTRNDLKPSKDNPDHPSEIALDNEIFDEVIINDGTIKNLINKVKTILIKHNIN